MTENRTRAVEEPVGYDYPPTDRIPVPGELSGERTDHRTDDHRTDDASPLPDEDRGDYQADAPLSHEDRTDYQADTPLSHEDRTEHETDAPLSHEDRAEHQVDEPLSEDEQYGERSVDESLAHDGRDGHEAETVPPGTAMTDPLTPVESSATPTESTDTEELSPAPTTGAAKVGEETDFLDNNEVDRFRDRWRELQGGFVDDPAQAVRDANDLVDELMRELAERKNHLEGKWSDASDGKVGTEELRVVIREYRAFFDRLLNA